MKRSREKLKRSACIYTLITVCILLFASFFGVLKPFPSMSIAHLDKYYENLEIIKEESTDGFDLEKFYNLAPVKYYLQENDELLILSVTGLDYLTFWARAESALIRFDEENSLYINRLYFDLNSDDYMYFFGKTEDNLIAEIEIDSKTDGVHTVQESDFFTHEGEKYFVSRIEILKGENEFTVKSKDKNGNILDEFPLT